MFRTSILSAVALAFATSSVACVAPAGDRPAPPEAPIGSTSQELTILPTAASVLVYFAEQAAEGFVSKKASSILFPAPTIDFARVAQDFAAAAKQANDEQTVSEQAALIDGLAKTLNGIEVRLTTNKEAAANDPAALAKLDAAAYDEVYKQWPALNDMLSNVSQPGKEARGLAAYVSGAQLKLSILTKLIQLRPSSADENTAVLVSNAQKYIEYVVRIKRETMEAALTARMAAFTPCGPYNAFNDGSTQYTNPDGFTCTSRRGLLMAETSAKFIGSMNSRLTTDTIEADPGIGWIDQMVQSWNQMLGARAIRVVSATYDDTNNPLEGRVGNVTAQVSMNCENQLICSYKVDVAKLGDPVPYAPKNFVVKYQCVKDGPVRIASTEAEANGKSVELWCED